MAKTKQQPAHEIRMGAIKATIWENQTTAGTRHNVTVSRIYKDGDEWKQTETFGSVGRVLRSQDCGPATTVSR